MSYFGDLFWVINLVTMDVEHWPEEIVLPEGDLREVL